MDAIDIEILRSIQRDASAPQALIGEELDCSPATINRRVQKLKESGYITKISANLNPDNLQLPLIVIAQVEIKSETKDQIDKIKRSFLECENVQICLYVTGEWDFILQFVLKDMQQYTKLTRELFLSNPNVQRFKSLVVMDKIKYSLDLPI